MWNQSTSASDAGGVDQRWARSQAAISHDRHTGLIWWLWRVATKDWRRAWACSTAYWLKDAISSLMGRTLPCWIIRTVAWFQCNGWNAVALSIGITTISSHGQEPNGAATDHVTAEGKWRHAASNLVRSPCQYSIAFQYGPAGQRSRCQK